MILDKASSVILYDRASESVRLAAADVETDLRSVFGPRRAGTGHSIIVEKPTGASSETFELTAAADALLVRPADARGAIYGLYAISEQLLGIPPMHFWCDWKPQPREQIEVAAAWSYDSGKPSFKRRGWFINDEDLLTFWAMDSRTGICLDIWDRIFEALLRSRGNMMICGTHLFPDEPQVELAARRGLTITQHHMEPLGLNAFRWPAEVDYNFARNPQPFRNAWERCVRAGAHRDTIWTIGYRGKDDWPIWRQLPELENDRPAVGRLISKALHEQAEIVRRIQPNAPIIHNLWSEGHQLWHDGLLKVPDGVTLVWPDNSFGWLTDNGKIGAGQGVYMHVGMFNAIANQLSEGFPPELLARESARAYAAGATEYYLVNVSDFRMVQLGAWYTMRFAWDSASIGNDPMAAAKKIVREWMATQYGEAAADELTDLHFDSIHAYQPLRPHDKALFCDNANHRYAKALCYRIVTGMGDGPNAFHRWADYGQTAGEQCEQFVKRGDASVERWNDIVARSVLLEDRVAPERRGFYRSLMLASVEINTHSLDVFRETARAYLCVLRGASPEADRHLQRAVEANQEVLAAFAMSETPPWEGFFRGDLWVNVRGTTQRLRQAQARLRSSDPERVGKLVETAGAGSPWHQIKGYHGDRRVDVSPVE